MTVQGLRDKYFELLRAYVSHPTEEYLAAAADLGREMVLASVPPEDIAEIHEQALERLAQERPDMTLLDTVRLVSAPLMELLMAYGLAFREGLEKREQAEAALHRYIERLRALRAIDGTILAAWSLEEVCHVALRHLRRLVPCLGAGIVMFDFEAREAVLVARHTDGEFGLEVGMRIPLKMIVHIEELRQGKVVVGDDLQALARMPSVVRAVQAAGVCSYVAAPLIAHGELIGLLALGAGTPGAFDAEQLDVVHEIADEIAVALRQARLRTALAAEKQRMEALVTHMPDGVLLLDDEYRILLANPAADDLLPALTDAVTGDVLTHLADRPLEELLALPPEGLWHELEVAGPPARLFEVVAQPMTTEVEGRFVPVSGGTGDARGWMLLIQDVTQEREMRRRLQRQERLAALGQMAGGIAHDFNNFLTTIMLYAQMLLRMRDLSPDVTRSLETILDESRRAADLVQQILDFSRHAMLKVQSLDLEPFIGKVIDVLQRTIPENIRLTLSVGEEKYVVRADPTRIQQALMNLATNARDAMPDGGELRFELSRLKVGPDEKPPLAEMEPGEWVCLAVSDTGVGMTDEVRAHLFEPFFTTKEPGKGTGLGLAQVYGIVKQHGGHVGVETEVGQGATFRLYLLACEVEEVVEGEVSAVPRGRGETILLVEDNEKIREAGRAILESLGYRVQTAANGREALEIYHSVGGVDLTIADLVMPEMGGRALVKRLRETTSDLKALAITGYIMEEDIRRLRKMGFMDVVYKPFDVNVLAQVVRRALDGD